MDVCPCVLGLDIEQNAREVHTMGQRRILGFRGNVKGYSSKLSFKLTLGPALTCAGNGSARDDISGIDFKPDPGDFGDPDLAEAIAMVKGLGRRVPLCLFGHMHNQLNRRYGTAQVVAV